tara:strand:+ start:2444 stop:2692 length:249 start_codon:yes stop_codon:yes gene_type:complete
MATKSTMSNQQLLIEMKRMITDIKNIVIDLNKRNKLLSIELAKTKQQIIELDNRIPVRKQGLLGGYWELGDNLSKSYENINN